MGQAISLAAGCAPAGDPRSTSRRLLHYLLIPLLVLTQLPALLTMTSREVPSTSGVATALPSFVLPPEEDPPFPSDIKIDGNGMGTMSLKSLPLEAQYRANSALGEVDSRFHLHSRRGIISAYNPDQGFTTEFAGDGPVLHNGDHHLGVSLTGVGYGTDMLVSRVESRKSDANSFTYTREGLVERYDNGPLGLAQRIDVGRRPHIGDSTKGLIVGMSLSGGLVATLQENERSITFADRHGKDVLSYSGLKVLDATGRSLPARLEIPDSTKVVASGTGLGSAFQIRVADQGAQYPITIDPNWEFLYEFYPDSLGTKYAIATLLFHNELVNHHMVSRGAAWCPDDREYQVIAIGARMATAQFYYEDYDNEIEIEGEAKEEAGKVILLARRLGQSWGQTPLWQVTQDEYWSGPIDPIQAGAHFGASVDLAYGKEACSPILAVGATDYLVPQGVASGAVFVYQPKWAEPRPDFSNEVFHLSARLAANAPETNDPQNHPEPNISSHQDRFGATVAVSVGHRVKENDFTDQEVENLRITVAVGAPYAYVMKRGDGTAQQPEFISADAGRAYVYVQNNNWWEQSPEGEQIPSNKWDVVPTAQLLADPAQAKNQRNANFGFSIDMEDHGQFSTIVVGAPGEAGATLPGYAGRAYVFNKRPDEGWGGPSFAFPRRVGPSQGVCPEHKEVCDVSPRNEDFGWSVAIRRDPRSWNAVHGNPNEEFPARIVVGDPKGSLVKKNGGGVKGGLAYEFAHVRPSNNGHEGTPSWEQQAILVQDSNGGTQGGLFGKAVAINSDATVTMVGAPRTPSGGRNRNLGRFFTFEASYARPFMEPTGTPEALVTPTSSMSSPLLNNFGAQIALAEIGSFAAATGFGQGNPSTSNDADQVNLYTAAGWDPSVTQQGKRDVGFDSDGKALVDLGGIDVVNAVKHASNGTIVLAGKTGNDFVVARLTADGALDSSFGSGGKVVSDWGGGSIDELTDVAVGGDGSIVTVGKISGGDFAVFRYHPDGTPDTDFDGDGKVSTDLGGNDQAAAVALLSNGGILVAGTSNGDFALVNYDESGALDTNFGGDGIVTTDFGGSEAASALTVWTDVIGDPDEGTLAWRAAVGGRSGTNFAVAQYDDTGALDTSFDSDGKVTTDFGAGDEILAIDHTADGELIAAGVSSSNAALARYLPDGSLDPSFDVDGRIITDFGGSSTLHDIEAMPDGKVMVSGTVTVVDGTDFAVARYWGSNGALDHSFSGDGKATVSLGAQDSARAMDMDANGHVVVAGTMAIPGSGNGEAAVARLNPDGSLDSGFDGEGHVTTDLSGHESATGILVQPDGKLVATGFSNGAGSYDFAATRYLPGGALDPSFSGDGKVVTDIWGTDQAQDSALQKDGKIVLAGRSGANDFALVRYRADGSLDPTFDGDGVVTTNMGATDVAWAVDIASDGKIIAAGGNGVDFAIARYNPDGSLDSTFSGDGKLAINDTGIDVVHDLAIQGDGKIVLAGDSRAAGSANVNFAMARIYDTGELDGTFSGDGKLTTDFGGTETANAITQSNDGRLIVAGGSSGNFALARYHADGSLDATFDGDGMVVTDFGTLNDTAYDVDITPGGSIVAAGRGGDDIAWVCYASSGAIDTDCPLADDGKQTLNIGGVDNAYALAFERDGTLVLAGRASFGNEDFALVRFNGKHGAVDPDSLPFELPSHIGEPLAGFGTGGMTTTDLGGWDSGYDSAPQDDGKIVVVGESNNDVVLARYDVNGALDMEFGDDGIVTTDVGVSEQALSVIVLRSGSILTAGTDGSDFLLTAYNEDGTLNETFGEDGIVTTDLGGTDVANDVLELTDGRITAVGSKDSDFAVVTYLPDGSLDSNFSGDGIAVVDMGGSDTAFAAALDADRNLVVAGGASGSFALARFLPSGSLDPSLSSDGKADVDFGASDDYALAVTVQMDGRILLSGKAQNPGDFALARFLPDGSVDTGYGSGGKVTTNLGGNEQITALGLQPDGKILVAGTDGGNFLLARYQVNGTLDTGFGTGGSLYTDFGGPDLARGLTTDRQGRITLAGTGGVNNDFVLARYTPAGALDVGFSQDGSQVTNINGTDSAYLSAVQPDGKILVAARTGNNNFTVLRYNPDGSLDTSFDGDGWTNTDLGNADTAFAVMLQSDGKIVAVGESGAHQAIVRYLPDGSLDTSFSGDGKYTVAWAGGTVTYDGLIQPDGKIVTAGYTTTVGDRDFAIARFNSDGTPDTSFGGTGFVKTDLGATDTAARVTQQPDGRLVLAGNSGGNAVVTRYTTSGALDQSFDGDGKVIVDLGTGGDEANEVVVREDGQLWVGGTTSSDFALMRLFPNGALDASFDGDGKKTFDLGGTDRLSALALDSQDGLVLAGYGGPGVDFAFVVLDKDGYYDTDFDGDGKKLVSMSGGGDLLYGLSLTQDGTIVGTGPASSNIGLTVMR